MDFSEPLWLQFVAQRKSANIRIETKSLVSWTISKLHHIHNPTDRRLEPGGGAWPGLDSGGFLSGHEYKVYDLI